MKVETRALTGALLDYAVDKLEWERIGLSERNSHGANRPKYSTDWSYGGPIMEREEIDVYCYQSKSTTAPLFEAEIQVGPCERARGRGDTMLKAAMRCYVQAKLGKEVEIPEELL